MATTGPGGAAAAPRALRAPNIAAVLGRIEKTARVGVRDGGHDLEFEALGTYCRVSFGGASSSVAAVRNAVLQWVAAFEARYSRFLPDSLISQINQSAGMGWVALDAETEKILALCDQMVFFTRGVFDPTALPLMRLWNWKEPPKTLPDEAALAAARAKVGWRKVQRAPGRIQLPLEGMCLDLGGMGKEFAVDQVAMLVRSMGAKGVLVDFGADIRVSGPPPDGRPAWHVGLDDPRRPGKPWCGLGIADGAVATSGDYLRKFEVNGRRYGHIVDVRTGWPVDNGCRGVSVVAPTCTLAGMLSTAVFMLGPVDGMRLVDAQVGTAAAIVTDTGIVTSRKFYEHVVSS